MSETAAETLHRPLPDPADRLMASTSREGLGALGLEPGGGAMRGYEAMVIVDPRLEEGDIQKAVDRISTLIGEAGGEVSAVDRWGKRRFAFEIDHLNEGYYFVTTFTAPEAAVDQLRRTLQISDEYIRGKIVRPGTNGEAKQGA